MAKQTVNLGTAANDGTGTPLRDAFDMINDNFNEVYGNNFVTQAQLGAEFTSRADIPTDNDVDFATAAVFYQEMDGDSTYDVENAKVGDVKTLVLEGDGTDRTISFEMSGSTGTNIFKKMKGSDDFSFTDGDLNLVQMIVVDDTENAEQIWYSNSVVAS
jgi:hypothetical protein